MNEIKIIGYLELPLHVAADVEEDGTVVLNSVELGSEEFGPYEIIDMLDEDQKLYCRQQVSDWIELQWEKRQAMREDAAEARMEEMREERRERLGK